MLCRAARVNQQKINAAAQTVEGNAKVPVLYMAQDGCTASLRGSGMCARDRCPGDGTAPSQCCECYWARAPDARTTAAHFLISEAINAENSAGDMSDSPSPHF